MSAAPALPAAADGAPEPRRPLPAADDAPPPRCLLLEAGDDVLGMLLASLAASWHIHAIVALRQTARAVRPAADAALEAISLPSLVAELKGGGLPPDTRALVEQRCGLAFVRGELPAASVTALIQYVNEIISTPGAPVWLLSSATNGDDPTLDRCFPLYGVDISPVYTAKFGYNERKRFGGHADSGERAIKSSSFRS